MADAFPLQTVAVPGSRERLWVLRSQLCRTDRDACRVAMPSGIAMAYPHGPKPGSVPGVESAPAGHRQCSLAGSASRMRRLFRGPSEFIQTASGDNPTDSQQSQKRHRRNGQYRVVSGRKSTLSPPQRRPWGHPRRFLTGTGLTRSWSSPWVLTPRLSHFQHVGSREEGA